MQVGYDERTIDYEWPDIYFLMSFLSMVYSWYSVPLGMLPGTLETNLQSQITLAEEYSLLIK